MLDNADRLDKLVNGPAATVPDRAGQPLDSWRQIVTMMLTLSLMRREGHNRMAQVVRMVLIDVFKEAQHAGHVPPGYNPAQATKQPRNKISRQRLSLEE